MALKLYDTWERRLRPFEPLQAGRAGVYCCGPTVYDYAHIGNLRTYLFEDLLVRALRARGYAVKQVMNITDVGHLTSDADTGEDKMEVSARRKGRTAWELADFYTEAFKRDLAALNIAEPDVWCRATGHIGEQLAFIEELERKGFTYQTEDGVYFDSTRLESYGHLARLDIQGLRAGARVEQGGRRCVTDFALWKFSPKDRQRQMEWDSPWGKGFPGWHIECSAMAEKHLGEYFDIHCGGEDHIPIHHTNEIAQTQAARGTRLANFWMHGYFLQLDNAKMAKSAGGSLTLARLVEEGYDPLAFRYLCFTAHYRTQMAFSWESLDGAQTALHRLFEAAETWQSEAGGEAGQASKQHLAAFNGFLDEDMNMPRALAALWELARSEEPSAAKLATLLDCDRILGFGIAAHLAAQPPPEVMALAEAREAARGQKDFALADQLREQIAAKGWNIKDTSQGAVFIQAQKEEAQA